jgi:hypothetical protein
MLCLNQTTRNAEYIPSVSPDPYSAVFLQPQPLVQYRWDSSVTSSTGNGTGFNLAIAAGSPAPALSAARQCRDRSCISISGGGYLTLPAYNFGQHRQLTFSMWYQPLAGSGSYARLFDFGNGQDKDNIILTRHQETSRTEVFSYLSNVVSRHILPYGLWVNNQWTHFTWTMTFTTGSEGSHDVYIDGTLVASVVMYFPANIVLRSNYIGKSNWPGEATAFVRIDSFEIYTVALSSAQVTTLMQVNNAAFLPALRLLHEHYAPSTCLYICVCVCVCICI